MHTSTHADITEMISNEGGKQTSWSFPELKKRGSKCDSHSEGVYLRVLFRRCDQRAVTDVRPSYAGSNQLLTAALLTVKLSKLGKL